ncbi:MAG: threonine/serine exporter family protein [Pygmaiobacter sp.]
MEQSELLSVTTEVAYDLLHCGAEIYRVEESVLRIFEAYGIKGGSVFAIPSLLIVSIRQEEGLPLSNMRRIEESTTHLEKIRAYNDLCRHICSALPDRTWIENELCRISTLPSYNFKQSLAAHAMVGFGFTLMFGGGIPDALAAFFVGAAVKLTLWQLNKFDTNSFFTTILASLSAAIMASLCVFFGFGSMTDKIIIGTLMILVPGTALTNTMRDIIAGDLIAGMTRLTMALLTATGIALGAGFGLTLMRLMGVT